MATTSVAMVAAIQEFGAPRVGIPPRPFFRNMVRDKQGEWPGAIEQALKVTDYDAKKALEMVGEGVAGQLRQSIVDLMEPELSPVTLMVRQIVGPNGRATFADVKEARRRVAAGETESWAQAKTRQLARARELLARTEEMANG